MAMDDEKGIGAMPLYLDVNRINNEIAALGVGPDDPLTPDQLYPFDQFHYHGIDAVRAGAGIIGLGRQSRVLEIGSGLGGPARYLAQTVGCHVTALELQQDLHDLASELTRRCSLNERITHIRGDALTYPLPVGGFDAVVSWLAIHHIPDRPQLMERLAHAVRPGGHMYVEDLVQRGEFSERDAEDVKELLYGVTITDDEDFAQDIDDAGFDEIDMTDMSGSWSAFVAARARAFRQNRERHVQVHGEEITSRLDHFFSTVERLFASGVLGGVRIAARRAEERRTEESPD
jgi:cyclopropane fatty-acyl-phospholipid synthase-like methyltransferase